MKSPKKLVTVVLPAAKIDEAESLRKRYGIRTLSALLRMALTENTGKLKFQTERTRQISFRADAEVVERLNAIAKKNRTSLSEVLRRLISDIALISPKKLETAAAGGKRKTVPAKKKSETKKPVSGGVPAKKSVSKKSAKLKPGKSKKR